MSYTVEYNPELRKTYPMKSQKLQKFPIKYFVIAISIFLTLYITHKVGFLQLIIPGDIAVTTSAFYSMVENVQSGQAVSDAVVDFFRNVIDGGKLL